MRGPAHFLNRLDIRRTALGLGDPRRHLGNAFPIDKEAA
jgi:hypothetical protein